MRVLRVKREIVKKYNQIVKMSEKLEKIVGTNKQFEYDYNFLSVQIERQFNKIKKFADQIKKGYWDTKYLSLCSYQQLFGDVDKVIEYLNTNLDFLQRRANVCGNIVWEDKETTDFRNYNFARVKLEYKQFEEDYIQK